MPNLTCDIYRVDDSIVIKGKNNLNRYLQKYYASRFVKIEQWECLNDAGVVQWMVVINP